MALVCLCHGNELRRLGNSIPVCVTVVCSMQREKKGGRETNGLPPPHVVKEIGETGNCKGDSRSRDIT